jgi:hypothetical protein
MGSFWLEPVFRVLVGFITAFINKLHFFHHRWINFSYENEAQRFSAAISLKFSRIYTCPFSEQKLLIIELFISNTQS